MKFYFSIITKDHWTAKNKAHEEAKELAQAMSRTLISEAQIVEYQEDFRARLNALNQRNPKCNDLPLDFWRMEGTFGQIHCAIPGVAHLQLIEVQYVTNAARQLFCDVINPLPSK